MSRENVELVRRIYEQEMFQQDPRQLLDLTAPHIEYVNPPEAIEPGVRRGRAEVAQAVKSAHEFFESPRYELNELHDFGDTVVAALTFYARARGTEIEIVQKEAHTWTLRDGRIVRFEWGRDLGTALEAARLREEGPETNPRGGRMADGSRRRAEPVGRGPRSSDSQVRRLVGWVEHRREEGAPWSGLDIDVRPEVDRRRRPTPADFTHASILPLSSFPVEKLQAARPPVTALQTAAVDTSVVLASLTPSTK